MRESVYSRLRYAFLISYDDNGFCVAYGIKRWKQNRLMKRAWCHRYCYDWINWLFPLPPSIVEFLYFRDKHHQHGYFAIENNALEQQLDGTSAASNDLDVRWKRITSKTNCNFWVSLTAIQRRRFSIRRIWQRNRSIGTWFNGGSNASTTECFEIGRLRRNHIWS